MSHLSPKVSEYGLSSDDDGDEIRGYGLFDDRRLNNRPHRRTPSRNRDKKWRGHASSSGSNKYSKQNSVSLADFDEEYVDNGDEDDDELDEVKRAYGRHLLPRRERSGAQVWLKSAVQLLMHSSKWKIALIGLLLGLVCAMVYKTYPGLRSSEVFSSGLWCV